MFLERSAHPTSIRRARRGFTLIELVVVVVIIGITAALATPQVLQLMRERRGRQAAQAVALVYSSARMRAMGRGAAVLVQYNRTGTPTFTVRESIEGTAAITRGQAACATQPGLGCLTTQWTVAADSRVVETLELDAANSLNFSMYGPTGTQYANFDVCFTPAGRSFSSTTGVAPTNPMTTPVTFKVLSGLKSQRTFYTRTVVILPNGTARIGI